MKIANLCRKCKGDCCRGPWLTDQEYMTFATKLGNDKVIEGKPYQVLGGWQFASQYCPALAPDGCVLPDEDRPEPCRIYPFAKIPTPQGFALLLDVSRCRYWKQFGERYEEVKKEMGLRVQTKEEFRKKLNEKGELIINGKQEK